MNPDRLRQIEELYHSARETSGERRAALLITADPELRREVESLLARQDENLPPLDVHTMTLMPSGARLGPYQVESKLGEGGMGEVFRAVDTRLGRAVAIKVVDKQFTTRFEREARAISSLNHPHICTLYDIGANYLVMELLEGETLAARLKGGPLQAGEAFHYAAQIAAGLAEAHENGIVHRDLKPGNIMLTKSGAKILDFGLATWEGDDTVSGGRMMGTPAYMAPEQREAKPADARTDIYSFGCVLYEMLSGTRATADRKPLPSGALERVVARCLETDRARRWQSTAELVSALDSARAGNTPWARTNRKWIIPAAAVFAMALIVGYFVLRSASKLVDARKLTDRDTIILADFANSTGDPVFDGTLRQGLAFQLEQSPFLRIMDDAQMQQNLGLMRLPPATRITNQIAREICLRDGGAATIDGSIAGLGKSYVVTVQATTCQGGETLAREQIQAEGKEQVLNALGTAATALRARLGESRSSIQKLNRPLEQATTGSLEALQNYSAGYAEWSQGRFLAARPLMERAIALDPNFALAYVGLAAAYGNAGDTRRESEYNGKAFELIERVSEREREMIAALHYQSIGDLDKAIDAYRLGIGGYPRWWLFHNNLSENYIQLGQFEEGLKEGQAAAELQPGAEPPWRRLLDAYICLDRLDEAKKVAETARKSGVVAARLHQRLLEMAYVEGDQAAIAKEIQWYSGKPEEYLSFGLQAANRNVLGQRRESGKLYKRAAEIALRRGLREVAAGFEDADARADALSGNCGTVRRLGRPALALAMCGDAAGAEKLAGETSKFFPNGTVWNAVQLPAIRAAIELHRREPAKAVELLASALPFERAYPEAVYLRGLAYLRLHKGAEAAAEFQKILDHKGASWASTWKDPNWGLYYSISHLGVARAAQRAGDTAKARKTFQNFFALWNDADQDLPVLIQAKKDYAALR
ncbi:MAG TPA: protein kinase [Bryobacteraceae bacterium]|nr:protein kinase [Bryobacteraceae bacterium]